MAYYSTHGFSQFLLNNEKQRVRFLLAHPVLKDFHLTCNMLLHYLVKFENPKMLLILTAYSTNC